MTVNDDVWRGTDAVSQCIYGEPTGALPGRQAGRQAGRRAGVQAGAPTGRIPGQAGRNLVRRQYIRCVAGVSTMSGIYGRRLCLVATCLYVANV